MVVAREHDWVGDVSSIRQGWVPGRNASAAAAIERPGEVDAVVWVDDDVLLDPGHIARLLRYDEDFITGVLYQKLPPHYPLISRWNAAKGGGFSPFETWPPDTITPADGCGFGIVVTSTALLRKVLATRPEGGGCFDQSRLPDGRELSEDLSFCKRAKEVGMQLWFDPLVTPGHQIGPTYATAENHRATAAERAGEKE